MTPPTTDGGMTEEEARRIYETARPSQHPQDAKLMLYAMGLLRGLEIARSESDTKLIELTKCSCDAQHKKDAETIVELSKSLRKFVMAMELDDQRALADCYKTGISALIKTTDAMGGGE